MSAVLLLPLLLRATMAVAGMAKPWDPAVVRDSAGLPTEVGEDGRVATAACGGETLSDDVGAVERLLSLTGTSITSGWLAVISLGGGVDSAADVGLACRALGSGAVAAMMTGWRSVAAD